MKSRQLRMLLGAVVGAVLSLWLMRVYFPNDWPSVDDLISMVKSGSVKERSYGMHRLMQIAEDRDNDYNGEAEAWLFGEGSKYLLQEIESGSYVQSWTAVYIAIRSERLQARLSISIVDAIAGCDDAASINWMGDLADAALDCGDENTIVHIDEIVKNRDLKDGPLNALKYLRVALHLKLKQLSELPES